MFRTTVAEWTELVRWLAPGESVAMTTEEADCVWRNVFGSERYGQPAGQIMGHPVIEVRTDHRPFWELRP